MLNKILLSTVNMLNFVKNIISKGIFTHLQYMFTVKKEDFIDVATSGGELY